MTSRKSVWQALGLGILLLGSVSVFGLALADEDHKTEQKMPHQSDMMGGTSMKGHGMGHGYESFSPLAMKEKLGLNEEQVKALEAMDSDYRKTSIKSRADRRVAMIDLGSLLDQKNPDRSAIAVKVDEISNLKKQMMMYRIDSLLNLKEVLTPEQYDTVRAQMKARMEGGKGYRMHGMGGTMGHGKMGDYDEEKEEN